MDNPQQYVDENTFRWTVGGVVSAFGLMLGAVWKRMNGVEDKHDRQAGALSDKQHDGDDALWDAVNKARADFQAFQVKTLDTFREVPTKSDLQAMESRIMSAITSTHRA